MSNAQLVDRMQKIADLAESDADDRYVRFAEEVLGQRLAEQQRQILQALADHKRTVIMSGNGPGKSYGVALAKLSFLILNPPAVVLGTSGSYSQYVDAVWRTVKNHYKSQIMPLDPSFTDPSDSQQPSIELEDQWFAKVVSPRDPGELEGRHGPAVLVVIEEADKKYITEEHFDSARSSVTDSTDRMLAICNPPKDEANPVYSRIDGEMADDWHTINFSTLNAHNVRVDAGEVDGRKIPGITDLETVRDDWEAYNGEGWPGLHAARAYTDPDSPQFREDLDSRWYRRRGGVMPPSKASAWRPITKANVLAAWDRDHPEYQITDRPMGTGVDVARSGADWTVAATALGDRLDIRYEEAGDDHTRQRDAIHGEYADATAHPIAVDAIGEGSGLADMLSELFDGVLRFGNGNEPTADKTYYSCWEEGLDLLGDWLAAGGSINDSDLKDELLVAARLVTFEERHYASRGGEVAKATASKDDIKQRMGRSPDRLDAAMMALWARDSGATAGAASTTARSGGRDDDHDTDGDRIRDAINQYQQQYRDVQRGGKWS
jgi:hypothetical protein